MTELVTVKGVTYNSRVALSERHQDHPSGEAYVIDGMVAKVALTPEVQTRLGSGLLVLTDEEPTEPFEGYGSMSAEKVASHMEKMGDVERLIVQQYEATHGKRKVIIEATPAPVEDYDAMNAGDVVSLVPTLDESVRALVLDYETKHKARKSVLEALNSAQGV